MEGCLLIRKDTMAVYRLGSPTHLCSPTQLGPGLTFIKKGYSVVPNQRTFLQFTASVHVAMAQNCCKLHGAVLMNKATMSD